MLFDWFGFLWGINWSFLLRFGFVSRFLMLTLCRFVTLISIRRRMLSIFVRLVVVILGGCFGTTVIAVVVRMVRCNWFLMVLVG